jgi:transposase-like protein
MAQSVLSAARFQDEAAAFEYVEARLWPHGPICPHCGNFDQAKIGRLEGKTTRLGLRKCYACQKPFTVRMGTIFESSHLPLHLWLQVIHLMCASKKGISTRQIQRMLQCSMKTAWFLGHRIREAMTQPSGMFPGMGGTGKAVEVDETYVGRKAGSKMGKPLDDHRIVLSLVEREGKVRSLHIANVRADTLKPILFEHVIKGTRVMTDEAPVYGRLGWQIGQHKTVGHRAHEYVRGDVHTNTVEGYFSILKRGMYGVFQHVAPVHLQRYLTEFDFRYNYRAKLGYDDIERADKVLLGVRGKRLTYTTPRSGESRQAH